MDLSRQTVEFFEGLLGHGDAPAAVSLPMATWAVAAVGDGLAMVTGRTAFDGLSRLAIGAGLVGTLGAMATGFYERRSGDVSTGGHVAGVAAHAGAALAVGGLFAASLALRLGSGLPSPLARSLALAGGGLALANAAFTRHLVDREHALARGLARLDPSSPLGTHGT